MKLLDYDTQRAVELLKGNRLPSGVNKRILEEFMRSGKPTAIVGVRDNDEKAAAQKGQNLRYVAKKHFPGEINVFVRKGSVILVRAEQLKNLGV